MNKKMKSVNFQGVRFIFVLLTFFAIAIPLGVEGQAVLSFHAKKNTDVNHELKATRAISESVSATYTRGDISTDKNFTSISGSSSCPGTLIVTIPVGVIITGVDVAYNMTARWWGWISEQRSQLRCVSAGGTSEASLNQVSGNYSGTHSYLRTGLTIANGVTGGGDIVFELHAGRTYGGSNCSTTYNRVDNNTWTVTVYYTTSEVAGFSANITSVALGQPVVFTDQSGGNITSWSWNFGEGASPATANTQGPHTVVYNTEGYKTVSLTVNDTLTETKTDYIRVIRPDDWLHWDDGVNSSSVGLTGPGTFQIAARFESSDIFLYSAYQITKVRIYVGDLPSGATLIIWQGSNQQNLTPVVNQSFNPVADSWNLIELDNPYNVNINEELWLGAEYDDPGADYYVAGTDATVSEDGKSNLIRTNINDPSSWAPLSDYNIGGDWNIQAYLQPVAISWTGNVSSDWHNGSNWSSFSVPQQNTNVIIPVTTNNPQIDADAEVQNISIESGASLTIGSLGSLSVAGILNNQAGTGGLMILSDAMHSGKLLHNSDQVPGSFARYITGDPEAWHLLSAPVTDQEISGEFTPSGTYGDGTGYDFYTWYEPDTSWVYLLNTDYPPTWSETQTGNNFIPAKGYLVSYQAANPVKTFSGILGNGTVSIDLTRTVGVGDQFGTCLVGNPYPSAIDWKAVSGWDRTALEPDAGGYNIWIWNDTANNYGVYNSASANNDGTLGASRYIAPSQGFFVQAAQSGALSMTNEVRTISGTGNWLKSGEKRNLLFFSMESEDGSGNDQVGIEFGHAEHPGGTPKKFSFVPSAPGLFIPRNGSFYSMLLLNTPAQDPVIPLSVKTGTDGNYTIMAFFDDSMFDFLVLKDQLTGMSLNLLDQQEYHFSSRTADPPGRFIVQFEPGVFPDPHEPLPAGIYTNAGKLYIDLRLVDTDCRLEIFDLTGRRMCEAEMTGREKYEIPLKVPHGIYLVRVTGNTGTAQKKVIN